MLTCNCAWVLRHCMLNEICFHFHCLGDLKWLCAFDVPASCEPFWLRSFPKIFSLKAAHLYEMQIVFIVIQIPKFTFRPPNLMVLSWMTFYYVWRMNKLYRGFCSNRRESICQLCPMYQYSESIRYRGPFGFSCLKI